MKPAIYLPLTILLCVASFFAGRSSLPTSSAIDEPVSSPSPPPQEPSRKSEHPATKQSPPVDPTHSQNPPNDSRLQTLEAELHSLRAEHKKIRKRYEMLAPPQPQFRFHHIGFNYSSNRLPAISEETYEFLQLDPKTEKELRAVSDAFIEDLLQWERSVKGEVVQDGKRLEVSLRPMNEAERNQRLHYRERMKELLGPEDFEMLDASFSNAVRNVFGNRLISVELISENGKEHYRVESQYFDEAGNPRGHASSTGPEFPERWAHLFDAP